MIYEKMRPEERLKCAELAAEAFSDYEYFKIYIEDEKRRHRFLDALLKCEFKANAGLESVSFLTAKEDDKIVAVAQLCSPEYVKPDDMSYVKAGWLSVLLKGGIRAVNAWNAMEKEASAPCHGLSGNIWYLSLLTVNKEYEGKGLGSRFMQECLIPYVKEQGAGSFSLFTNSEINRRFYQKNGFSEFDQKNFSYKGKTIGNWSCIMHF